MVKRISFIVVCITHVLSYAVLDQAGKKYISQHMRQYERPFTVFEACGASAHAYSVGAARIKKRDASYNILLFEPSKKLMSQVQTEKPNSLVVMSPQFVKASMLKTMSRCEQPDVVLVHDVPTYFKDANYDFVTPFLDLGDYLAIDIEPSDLEMFKAHEDNVLLVDKIPHANGDGGFLAFFKTEKKGTQVPRWTSTPKGSEIKYLVKSSFSSKTMYKKALKTTTEWHKGINLLTFVMLSGVYPPDNVIIKEAKSLSRLKHNDLVIGNLLIQGTKLKAIDFNDKRHDISVQRCLKALLAAFERDRKRFSSPKAFHDYYRKMLD